MANVIKEIFERERESLTYRRIDAVHPIDIYIGYDIRGHKSLVIVGKRKQEHLVPSKIIDLGISKKTNGEYQLSFTLLDDNFTNLFYKFCDDMIESCRNTDKENVLKYAISRWNYWRYMFRQSSKGLLTQQQVMGLLGELVFLQEYMIPTYGLEASIKAWRGPEGAHKDFEVKDLWYEIKAVSVGATSLKISSIEQLESSLVGNLVVVKLSKTSPNVVGNSININQYIQKVFECISDIYLQEFFIKKLECIGYTYLEEYDNYCYFVNGLQKYKVDETFPRITRDQLPTAIEKVSYEVSISSLECHKEEIRDGTYRV